MNEKLLPKNIYSCLESENIHNEDLKSYCRFDLSSESKYIFGYMVASESELIIFDAPRPEKSIIFFKGTGKAEITDDENLIDFNMTSYKLDDIEDIRMEHRVATNLVTANVNGVPSVLCALSNLFQSDAGDFIKAVIAIKSNTF